jgi:prepilin-type N-terminal cleavage/methylation domain-containing protein
MSPDKAAAPLAAKVILNQQAFTLIEMVVVTALISIMLIVAIPRLQGNILSSGGDEAARWIIANVRQAKENAVSHRKIYLLNVSLDSEQLWVAPADLAETEAATAREQGFRLPRDVSLDHVARSRTDRFSSGTIAIAFYPQGYSDKAVIRMHTNDGDRLSFFIEPFLPGVDLIRGSQGWES